MLLRNQSDSGPKCSAYLSVNSLIVYAWLCPPRCSRAYVAATVPSCADSLNDLPSAMQFYWTTGGGGYRERLGESHQETNVVFNTGGGAKVSVVGPLKVRFDYRVMKLHGSPLFSTLHRLYAGLNVSF